MKLTVSPGVYSRPVVFKTLKPPFNKLAISSPILVANAVVRR